MCVEWLHIVVCVCFHMISYLVRNFVFDQAQTRPRPPASNDACGQVSRGGCAHGDRDNLSGAAFAFLFMPYVHTKNVVSKSPRDTPLETLVRHVCVVCASYVFQTICFHKICLWFRMAAHGCLCVFSSDVMFCPLLFFSSELKRDPGRRRVKTMSAASLVLIMLQR